MATYQIIRLENSSIISLRLYLKGIPPLGMSIVHCRLPLVVPLPLAVGVSFVIPYFFAKCLLKDLVPLPNMYSQNTINEFLMHSSFTKYKYHVLKLKSIYLC